MKDIGVLHNYKEDLAMIILMNYHRQYFGSILSGES